MEIIPFSKLTTFYTILTHSKYDLLKFVVCKQKKFTKMSELFSKL